MSTIGVTEMDKNQIDLNVLNQETETEFDNDDTKHSKTGVRNRFVNYLDHTCMKCTPIDLMQKKKGILSLYELCKLLLGCNNDTCAALASYTKMHAYFKKFHSAGNLKVMKMEADDQVTFQISPKGFYGEQKEKSDDEAGTSAAEKKNEEQGRLFSTRYIQVKTMWSKVDKIWQKCKPLIYSNINAFSIVPHIFCRDK